MSDRVFGYARVSSREQNLDRQIEQLKAYVPEENIMVDKMSGENLNRPSYQALKSSLGLRSGDTLVIVSLDRLSRNKNDIKNELKWFQKNKIRIKILDLPTTMIQVPNGQIWILDMINNILVEVLASMAEQERLTIKKRQREGIEVAKKNGKHMGRPALKKPDKWDEYYEMWQVGEITATQMMKDLDIKKSSFYKLLRK